MNVLIVNRATDETVANYSKQKFVPRRGDAISVKGKDGIYNVLGTMITYAENGPISAVVAVAKVNTSSIITPRQVH